MPQKATEPRPVGLGISLEQEKQPERALPNPDAHRRRRAPIANMSQIPRPSTPIQGYPSRRLRRSPSPTSSFGSPPLPPSSVASDRIGTKEDSPNSDEAMRIAKHRQKAYDMLEGRVPWKPFKMADFLPFERHVLEREERERYDELDGWTSYIARRKAQSGLAAGRRKKEPPLPAKEPTKAKARTKSTTVKMAEVKKAVKQQKETAQKPKPKSPPPSRPPTSSTKQQRRQAPKPQAPASSQAKASVHSPALAKTAAEQEEEEDLRAAIAASIADAKEKENRRAQEERPPKFRPAVSKHQERPQAPKVKTSGPTPAKANARTTAPRKTAAEQEEEDVRAAVAASLAGAQRQGRQSAQGRATAETRPTLRPPAPVRPDVTSRATEQPRYMSSTESQRRAQSQTSGHPRHPRPSEARPRAPERQARPPPAPPKSHLRGNPRDATTGEYLSEDAWNSQIM